MRVEGVGGELRHGYALAGRLERWALVPAGGVLGGDEHVVTGEIALDPYLARQEPLRLTLRVGAMVWTWEHARVEGGRLVITGAPVEGVKVLHGT